MRKHLSKDFNVIYHLDLGGDVGENPRLSGTKHNVFGIKEGVGITFLVKDKKIKDKKILYQQLEEFWTKEERLSFLTEKIESNTSIQEIITDEFFMDKNNHWYSEKNELIRTFNRYILLYNEENNQEGIFLEKYPGISTNRNEWVYDFSEKKLENKMKETIDFYNEQVLKYEKESKIRGNIDIKNFVEYKEEKIKWSRDLLKKVKNLKYSKYEIDKINNSLFRPFVNKKLYYDNIWVDSPSKFSKIIESENNKIIAFSGKGANKISSFITSELPNLDLLEKTQTFPFYNHKKQENISDWGLKLFQEKLKNEKITKIDIFNYIYGFFHHPDYVKYFGDFLKKNIPRIPILKQFDKISKIGKQLSEIHINYEDINEYPLKVETEKDKSFTFNISLLKLSRDKKTLIYNDAITIKDIPESAYTYKVNGRSPLEWIVDQYKNWEENADYVLSLIKKAITISIETTKLIDELREINFIQDSKKEDK